MNIREFTVQPAIPENLQGIVELAYNLRWSWDRDMIEVFRRLDSDLWETSAHNPVLMLGQIEQSRLEQVATDESFLSYTNRMVDYLHQYMASPSWFEKSYPDLKGTRIAYFSAEFGIAECLPIYSGGLGVLAGDHLKSASDLGLPLAGVGLLYQKGYFRQYLNHDGWQQESAPVNDFFNMPIHAELDETGKRLMVSIDFPGREVKAQVWRVDVGRVPLYLLDTNVAENAREDREITDQLYGGHTDKRIRQEILLGIGGIRVLEAIGIPPDVCHMNEGHSAFLALERIRKVMAEEGISFGVAREATKAGNLFTTHTPVPAGFDLFPPDLMDHCFSGRLEALSLSREEFLGLGRQNPGDHQSFFNMAILAIRLAARTNAVSKLHRAVSRRILGNVWPNVPESEVPLSHVTNGVHFQSWVSRDMSELLQRYIGDRWLKDFTMEEDWQRIDNIPDEEIWRIHERRRERLVAAVRQRLVAQSLRRGANRAEIQTAREALHPEALTIGFARRFASYKRATLILQDLDRLKRILINRQRPVQIIYAGKAHPNDNQGKELIRQIVHTCRDSELYRRIVFVEDYDMDLARDMLQGVDVWLNNPRRLMEASGTSGMKAAINGAINLSILDGWWHEAYSPDVGWAIAGEQSYQDPAIQDAVESRALYDLLENEVVPLFYDRATNGLPRGWVGMMKKSMMVLGPFFNSRRMVRQYTEQFYAPMAERWQALKENGMARAAELDAWAAKLRQHWQELQLESINETQRQTLTVGEYLEITASLRLGTLTAEELAVEILYGPLEADDRFNDPDVFRLAPISSENGTAVFQGRIPCKRSGQCGYALRVLPEHPDLNSPFDLGLISWF